MMISSAFCVLLAKPIVSNSRVDSKNDRVGSIFQDVVPRWGEQNERRLLGGINACCIDARALHDTRQPQVQPSGLEVWAFLVTS